MQSRLVSATSCHAGDSPDTILLFLNFQETANFLFSFCLYCSGVCFYIFFKLRGLSSLKQQYQTQRCSCFLIIYCTFFFCIIFSVYFSDMKYFVYFSCLLCSTSLATTMLDSYDVSEILNNHFKSHCVLRVIQIERFTPEYCSLAGLHLRYVFSSLSFGVAMKRQRKWWTSVQRRLWQCVTNPEKSWMEMRANGEETSAQHVRTSNKSQLKMM